MVTEQAKTASLELLTIAVQVKPGFSEITECRPLTRWNINNVLLPQKCLQIFPPVAKYNTMETDWVCAVKQSSFIAPSFRPNKCLLLLRFVAEVIFFSFPVFAKRLRQISFCLFTQVLCSILNKIFGDVTLGLSSRVVFRTHKSSKRFLYCNYCKQEVLAWIISRFVFHLNTSPIRGASYRYLYLYIYIYPVLGRLYLSSVLRHILLNIRRGLSGFSSNLS